MDKREMIGRALGVILDYPGLNLVQRASLIDALADQAIVIECKVRHDRYALQQGLPVRDYTDVTCAIYSTFHIEGHHGTPGKAIAIILPLEE